MGFSEIEDLGTTEIAKRYFGETVPSERAGAHLIHARRG
jgi:hypothetical protein